LKTAQQRLNDTTNYLQSKLSPTNYNEVMTLLVGVNVPTVSQALSVGNSNPLHKKARRAKRGAMLLAYLLIDNPGMKTIELARLKALPEGSEENLLAEVRSWFTLNAISPPLVALNAQNNIHRMPKWDNCNFNAEHAVRGVYHNDKPFNCYNACVFWAFQAGAISKRYLWNYLQGSDGTHYYPIYSAVGWDVLMKFAVDGTVTQDNFNGGEIVLPAGMTVYFETPTKVFGHVALSLGDGRVISQNSVAILPASFAHLSPNEQTQFTKMAHAETHIVSIRNMVGVKFNGPNGYSRLNVSLGPFWSTVLPNRR